MPLPDVTMQKLSAMALESAMLTIAEHAEKFAMTLDPDISGPDALKAFAAAMRNTNANVWATGKVEH